MENLDDITGGAKEIKKNNTRLTSTYQLSQLKLESNYIWNYINENLESLKEKPKISDKEKRGGLYGEFGGLRTPDLIGSHHRNEVI